MGVALRSFVAIPPYVMAGMLWGAAITVGIGLLRLEKHIIIFGSLIVALILGIYRFDAVERARPDLAKFYGQALTLRGIVWEEPERTSSVARLKVKVSELDSRPVPQEFFTLVTLRRYPEYTLGEKLEIQGLLAGPENFSDFDYVSYLARDDIYSTMSFPLIEKVGEGKGNKLKLILSRTKHAFEEKIDLALPEPHSAFLKGLLLGERESLPKELVEDFKRTGTTHIIALSGYNITLVGGFIMTALIFLTIPFRAAFWLAVSGIILFVILTGASPSVVRAGIMGVLVLIAQREGRMYRMANALVLAGALMIFHNPKILRFDAAFQLSFLATLGLIYLAPHLKEKVDGALWRARKFFNKSPHPSSWGQGRRVFEEGWGDKEWELDPRFRRQAYGQDHSLFPFKRIFAETISAQLMVLPLLIYLFGRVSIVSPVANVLVLFAVPYAMASGFATGMLGFFWEPLGWIAGWISWSLLEYQIRLIEFFAGFPAASIELGRIAIIPILGFYSILLGTIWRRSRKT